MTQLSSIDAKAKSAHSGATMDRKVKKAKPWYTTPYALIAVALFVLFGFYKAFTFESKSLSVDGQRLSVASVTRGTFEDFIPIRGRVAPAKTVFLDAVEGGRVERILVEDGTSLAAG